MVVPNIYLCLWSYYTKGHLVRFDIQSHSLKHDERATEVKLLQSVIVVIRCFDLLEPI